MILLPQVANRLEIRRRELEDQFRTVEAQQRQLKKVETKQPNKRVSPMCLTSLALSKSSGYCKRHLAYSLSLL